MCTLYNLGCKLNQYEGYSLQKKYAGNDDVVIVNTCCVTAEAAHKSRKKFHQAMKYHPECRIIATGCACTLHPEQYQKAHAVIDVQSRSLLIQDIFPEPLRSRYFLKIQEGCNEQCSFCIVSKIRDTLISKTISDVSREIQWACSRGFREIVLVGANIGLYGMDRGATLPMLLQHMSTIQNLPRIRLSSIEPKYLSDDLIAAARSIDLCRHFHIPIQSADKHVLKAMGRSYGVHFLERGFNRITSTFHHAAIGIDVIVGFPNEDNERFERTRGFINDMPISHAHIFPYSPRPGTEASALGDPIPRPVKRERHRALRTLVTKKNLAFRQKMRAHQFTIIIDQDGDHVSGLTDNYVRVEVDVRAKVGSAMPVEIMEATIGKTKGRMITP